MSANRAASWAYAEQFVAETPVQEAARERGLALGAMPVGTATGAALRVLAAAGAAKAVAIGVATVALAANASAMPDNTTVFRLAIFIYYSPEV